MKIADVVLPSCFRNDDVPGVNEPGDGTAWSAYQPRLAAADFDDNDFDRCRNAPSQGERLHDNIVGLFEAILRFWIPFRRAYRYNPFVIFTGVKGCER